MYSPPGMKKKASGNQCCLPCLQDGVVRLLYISHDNLLLVTGGTAEDVSTVLNTTDVLDLTTMKWTTPAG